MIKAIVYVSETGYTKEYANLLGKEISLPAYSLSQAKSNLDKDTEIIYLGWLMAGTIKGYKQANKMYNICAVCGVGMATSGSQIDDIKKHIDIKKDVPLFTLQGGFNINKLHGIYKIMMKTMIKTVGKSLSKKENRTKDEDDMLDMLLHGGNRVNIKNMQPLLDWYESIQ